MAAGLILLRPAGGKKVMNPEYGGDGKKAMGLIR